MRLLLIFLICVYAFTANAFAEVRRMALSSDGDIYAALSGTEDGKCYLVLYDANDAAVKPVLFNLGDLQTGRFFLIGGEYALIEITDLEFVKGTVGGLKEFSASRWVSVDIETGEIQSLFQHLTGADYAYIVEDSGEILATTPNDAGKAVFSRVDVRTRGSGQPTRFESGRDELTYALHRINLKNGRLNRLERGRPETRQWVVDGNGTAVARIDHLEASNKLRFFVADGGNFKFVSEVALGDGDADEMVVLGRGTKPNVLIARVVDGQGALSYRQYNMLTGEFLPGAVIPAGRNIRETYDPRRAIAHGLIVDGGVEVHHFDEGDQALQRLMEKSIADATVYVESVSLDGVRALLRANYSDKPTEWYLYDRVGKRLEIIAQN